MAAIKARTLSEQPVDPAYRALIRTMGLLRRVMEPYFAQYGISASQWGVLRALNRAEEEENLKGVRLTDLSDRLLVRPPSITGAVDRMERTGLVTRAASAKDQRAKVVRLTTSGRHLVERVQLGHAKRVKNVLGALRRDEQRQLRGLLDRLGNHLEVLTHAGRTNGNGHR